MALVRLNYSYKTYQYLKIVIPSVIFSLLAIHYNQYLVLFV